MQDDKAEADDAAASLQTRLLDAIRGQDSGILQLVAYDIDSYLLDHGELPDELFSTLRSVLADSRFWSMPGSWELLRMMDGIWDEFNESQRSAVIGDLVSHYAQFNDPTSCMLIVEMAGRTMPPDDAFRFLTASSSNPSETTRALTSYGLGLLLQRDRKLSARCVEALSKRQKDPSEKVRTEADLALKKWKPI